MQHSLADVIAYASAGERLAAGTVIGLGTVPGCSGAEVGRWLSPGDVVELSAGGLGRLRNTVGEPEPWRRPGAIDTSTVEHRNPGGRAGGPPGRPGTMDPAAGGRPWRVLLARNRVLDQVERWEVPGGAKPEDVVFDAAGRLYAGVEDGRIWRSPGRVPGRRRGRAVRRHSWPSAGPGGQPTRRHADRLRRLPGTARGWEENGHVRVLADSYGGRRLKFTNNAAVAADGTVGVREHDGWLYLGSLYETAVGRVPIPA